MDKVIISRHAAGIEFVAAALCPQGAEYLIDSKEGFVLYDEDRGDRSMKRVGSIPVLAVATADDVRGKVVYGNVPLHLAALAAEVNVIEFAGPPPRGQEYTLADMKAAGAVLRRYKVMAQD
jgi:hypothetical protein